MKNIISNVKHYRKQILFYIDNHIKNFERGTFLFDFYDERYWNSPSEYFNYNLNNSTKKIEDPVFFFHHKWDLTYEFWIMETLPLLKYYMKLRKKIPNLKLLRFKWCYHCKYINDTLKFLFGEDPNNFSVWIFEPLFYSIEDLYYPIKDYPIDWSFEYIPSDLDFILKKMINLSKKFSKNNYPKKVYLSRRNLKNHWHNRVLINEDEVVNLLNKYGYQEVFSDELSMVDEINLFNNAQWVITPIGSGCTNILFSNENSKWCIITSERYRETYTMAHNYLKDKYIRFDNTEINQSNNECHDINSLSYLNSPYYCNINKLEKFLREINFIR